MMFYIGSGKQLPEIKYNKASPGLHTQEVTGAEPAVKEHLSTPFVTYIGSSSGCGCNFKHALRDNGTWLPVSVPEDAGDDEIQKNQQLLYDFLRPELKEGNIELFCCWDGDQNEPFLFRAEVTVEDILDERFFFRERGLYRIKG